jgi:hypothetical protein
MTVSEVIASLETARALFGDKEVAFSYDCGAAYETEYFISDEQRLVDIGEPNVVWFHLGEKSF